MNIIFAQRKIYGLEFTSVVDVEENVQPNKSVVYVLKQAVYIPRARKFWKLR